ncbi:four helix bundle protein [Thermocoleostomius sinensis]|jgi:four helix bundle protein|uniref:Four helix bundle protein n=1 Tax=Thermocoleostomius sinensis A174 TaxID=2016057 RepID=A0A9E9C9B6_9CYAN|nr:four helix bundle protein [Thermocoleostomius sinensis]WAL62464.1 four helix bundle protein [Thermocoleostomius sinensis A174]
MSGNSVKDYKDLIVWQRGIVLVKRIYQLTQNFPAEEKFGLISQMRRAAVSIPSNIAEGQARHTTQQFIQFLSIAEGSIAELDTQLIVAVELGYCTKAESNDSFVLITELRKMLSTLRKKLSH